MGDMYFSLVEERSKRLLCLDSRDLSLLPPSYEAWVRDNPNCLWSCKSSRLDGKENFEFVIKSMPDDSEESTICYLCSTNVPTAYVSEHVNSSKHLAYQKIAEIGLDRVRQYRHMAGIESMKDNSEYFCENCVLVINLSDQNEHQKSGAHKDAVSVDEFLNDFASFYTTNDPTEVFEYERYERNDSNDDHFPDFDVMLFKINHDQTIPSNDSAFDDVGEAKKLIVTSESRSDTDIEMNKGESCSDAQKETNNNVDSLSDTHNEINDEAESPSDAHKQMNNKAESPSDAHKQINDKAESPSEAHKQMDDKAESPSDAHKQMNDKAESPLAAHKEMNNKVESPSDAHKEMDNQVESRSDAHKEMNNNIINEEPQPTKGCHTLEDYIKRLKEYGTVKLYKLNTDTEDRVRIETENGCELHVSVYNFDGLKRVGRNYNCKMCTVPFKSLCAHRRLESHISITAQSFKDKHCIRPLRGSCSHCVLCNEIIDNVVVHTQLQGHINRVEKALVRENIIPSINNVTIKSADSENEIAETRATEDTDANINSDAEKQYYCFPCDIYLHINNLDNHWSGSKHKINAKAVIFDCMNRSSKYNFTCKVCQTNFCNGRAAYEHIASFIHLKKYNECLANNEVIKAKDKFFCKCCGKKILKTRELAHIETHSHKLKLASYKVSCIDKNDIIRNIEIKYHDKPVETAKSSTKNYVEELNAVDTTNEKPDNPSAVSHDDIRTLGYQTDEEAIYAYNPKFTDNERMVYDEKRINEIKSSITALLENKTWNANASSNSSAKIQHKQPNKMKRWKATVLVVNELLESMEQYLNDTLEMNRQMSDGENSTFDCVVCNIKTNNEDIQKHVNSFDHVRIYREVVKANQLKFKIDRYVCYICSIYVETGKVLHHIATDEHKELFEALKNGDYVLVKTNDKTLMDKVCSDLKVMEDESDLKLAFNDESDSTIKVTNVKYHFRELYDNKTQLICVLCQELVENSKIQCQIHANDVKHNTKNTAVLSYNQIFKIHDFFVCGHCEYIVSDGLAHIADKRHVSFQKKDPKKNYCSACLLLPSDDFVLKDHMTSKLHLKHMGVLFHFYCNTCDLQLIDKDDNIERHNESSEHENNSLIIDANKVILKENSCVCDVCEVEFNRDGFEDHVNSITHIMLLHNHYYQPAPDYCSTVAN